jgi:hypothetical protein
MSDEQKTMRDHAVAHAMYGFRVFKLRANSKLPLSEGYQTTATNDAATVHAMWTDPVTSESSDHNIGAITGSSIIDSKTGERVGGDFFVVDVDVRDEKKGLETLDDLIVEGLTEFTRTTQTASGGFHYFYGYPGKRKVVSRANALGSGIDTKGEGGYVVMPGSVIDGEPYTWLYEEEIITAPDWLVDRCEKVDRPKIEADFLCELDLEENRARAIRYLEKEAPEAISPGGGNEATYKVACEVMARGISEEKTLELMLHHWNDDKAHPPWGGEELEKLVENAALYKQDPSGIKSAQADFYTVDTEPQQAFAYSADDEPSDLWADDTGYPADLAVGVLPKALEYWVRDEATRKGVNFGVAALPALITCAAAIPARFEVQVKQNDTGHTEHAILWGATVGRPSARKSPIMGAMVRPLELIDAEWASQSDAAARAHQTALAAWKRDSKGTDAPPPVAPPQRVKIISDTTTEAVVDVLAQNPHGLLNLQDELSQWAGNMDAYRQGKAVSRDAGYWLQTKSGNAYRVNRIGRATPNVGVNAVHIFGNFTPDILRKLAMDWGGSGLMQRFLLVNAPQAEPAPDLVPDERAQATMSRAVRALVELPWSEFVRPFRFAPTADKFRHQVVEFAHREISEGSVPAPLEGWLGKTEGEWARIAMVFHFVEWATGVDALLEEMPPPLINADVAERAARFLIEFQYPQQQYFYRTVAGLGAASDDEALKIAKRILAKGVAVLQERDIERWIDTLRGGSRRPLRLEAVNTLVMHKWLSPAGQHRSGTHVNKWRVNPLVHDGRFGSRADAEQKRLAAVAESIKRNVAVKRFARSG